MTTLLLALWPLFALIVAGYALRLRAFPSEAFWPGAERINYFILFPALLFSSLATAPLDNPALPQLAGAVMLGLGVAWIALLITKRLRGWSAARFGAITQGCCASTPTWAWRPSAACSERKAWRWLR